MPRKQTIRAALREYLQPLDNALGCIAHGTKITVDERVIGESKPATILFNGGRPIRLTTTSRQHLWFEVRRRIRIEIHPAVSSTTIPIRVITTTYAYRFADDVAGVAGNEILAYHWAPEVAGINVRRYPHLHLGSGIVRAGLPVIGNRASKLHIPTGRMSIESLVRFAIEEIDVVPIRADWDAVLRQGQDAFEA